MPTVHPLVVLCYALLVLHSRSKPLCLVGMSGAGKSYWAKQLRDECGFRWHDCDGEISMRLPDLIEIHKDEAPVHAVGRWMDMPWSEGFAERESQYLALEKEVTETALKQAMAQHSRQPQVVDTTGSVVHLDAALREQISKHCHVLYLRVDPSEYKRMLALFLSEPKPVVWESFFDQRAGEDPHRALQRCYPILLQERDLRYTAMATRVIDAKTATLQGLQTLLG